MERGRRVPRPEFLVIGDEVPDEGGIIAAMQETLYDARCPRRVATSPS
jgi:hypothetical protein